MQSIMKNTRFDSLLPGCFVATWAVCGVLTIFVPMLQWRERKSHYYQEENDNQQEEQEQAVNNENGCMWYTWSCRENEEGGNDQQSNQIPGWYSGWGASEEQRAKAIANGQAPGGLGFVYIWQLLMFIAILVCGGMMLRHRKPLDGLLSAMLVWTNLCFLSMWMLAAGAIETDEEALEGVGFFGQFSVLMFMTNFWYILHGLGFSVALWVRNSRHMAEANLYEAQPADFPSTQQAKAEPSSGYSAYSDPRVIPDQKKPSASYTAPTEPKKVTPDQKQDSDSESDDGFVKVV